MAGGNQSKPRKAAKAIREAGAAKAAKKIAAKADAGASSWREKLQSSKIKFDDRQKLVYCEFLAETGRKTHAAMAAAVCEQTVANHLKNDPEFADMVQRALGQYRDTILGHAYKLSVEGVDEPIVGGKDKDEVVAYKKVYATNILAMEMRKVDPSYKDRAEVDVNMKGGVLVTPAQMSPDEWASKYAPKEGEGDTNGE